MYFHVKIESYWHVFIFKNNNNMFEQPSLVSNTEKRELDEKKKREIVFPHGESALRLFRNKYKDEPEKAEILEEVYYEFFEQELENIEIFESEKLGAALPWTKINTGKLLEKIVAKYSGESDTKEILDSLMNKSEIKKQEFIFSSGSLVQSGYPFTFVEEAMHQIIVALKSDLASLQSGREIQGREIYTLGLPTNELGKISLEFLEKIKQDPFSTMGDLLSEFVEAHVPQEKEDLNIRLYGISTGASFAAATGERLVQNGVVAQDHKGSLPNLSIRMDSPVGLSKSTSRNWQIPLGYAAEFIYQTVIDPKFRLADPKFMGQVKKVLSERGITVNMTDADKANKTEAIKSIIGKLKEGVDFNEDLKVTKVTGLLDPLTFSLGEYKNEKERQEKTADGLGKNIALRSEENRREFMISMTHTPAFFRDSELKRCYEVANLVQKLQG